MTAPQGEIVIRPAGPWAADLLAELHAACFADAWPTDAMATMLSMPGVGAIVAAIGNQPAGLAIGRSAADEGEVLTLATLPRWRRHGIGRHLLSALTQMLWDQGARAVFLEVSAGNRPAIALYENAGFAGVGQRAGYYADKGKGADALILRRDL